MSGHRVVKAGADGAFEMPGLPDGVFKVAAGHPRYAESPAVEATVDPEGEPFMARLVLRHGGRIAGTARRRDGGPATDVFVTLRGGTSNVRPRSEIGPDGRFVLEPVAPGLCEVVLAAGRDGAWRSVFTKEVDVREGETATVDWIVSDVRVSGRVTRGGQPLANVEVALSNDSGGFHMSGGPKPMATGPGLLKGVTDADGVYELLVPVAGRYGVSLQSLGTGPEPLPERLRQLDVPNAETFRLDLAVPGWSFTGVVAAADTEHPLGATVRVMNAQGTSAGRMTTADGRFRLALDPGTYNVHVEAPKYVAERTTIEVAADRAVERSFRLTRGGSMKTRVLGAGGHGVADVRVVAATEDGRLVRSARTAPDGTVEIDGLTAGRYIVLAAGEREGFAVQAGVTPDSAEVVLTLGPPVRQRLVFQDENGKAIARTRVIFELLKLDGKSVAHEAWSRIRTTR